MYPENAPNNDKNTKDKKIKVWLTYNNGRIIYGMTVAPNLPIAELNPNPKVLFNVPYD